MSEDDAFYTAIDLLKSLISIPSPSREEDKAADLIENYLRGTGQNTFRKHNNIWAIAPGYDERNPTVLLNSHMDTVKPVSSWTIDPYSAHEKEGRIYGLGSNDAGASLISLLLTFTFLQKKKQPFNLIFLASAEEEISGKNGIESVLPELPLIEFAIVGEPTGMQPAIAEKGLMVLDCSVYGKSGHAAREKGDNAIYKVIQAISDFRDFKFPLISSLLGPVKMSVTQINGGTQHNVIPDRCDFVVDIRTNDLYKNQEIFDLLQANINCDMQARSFRLNSSRIDISHPFVQRAILLNLKPFGSPTLSDQALMPFPSVKIGPGDSSRSHTANEYIETYEIREAIELYLKLLDGLSL